MPQPTPTKSPMAPRTPYFVYGSLMSSAILFAITSPHKSNSLTPKTLKKNQMRRATLFKHKRHAVEWADFPAVVRTDKPEDFVEGYLVSGLTELQEARIAMFESGLYTDEAAGVAMGWGETGEVVNARVYVWGGSRTELLDPAVAEWSFGRFKESGMYKRSYRGEDGESDSEEEEEDRGGGGSLRGLGLP